VLGATARRLADATNVPVLLDSLTAELGDILRFSRVEIRDDDGRLLAASGTHGEALQELPLTAYGAPVGTLRWASDRPLRDVDRQLLEDVASQLGAVVHTAVLVDTLRDAQHRLVLAREEERRRLRRDLHDGLGPALASLTLKVDELRNRWPTLADPDSELVQLRSAIQTAVSDVRRIVEGLRPAPLDELGLAEALEQLTMRGSYDLRVDIDVRPLPPLPAAVEVAVFRVVEEALLNARRHARAGQVAVAVDAQGGFVHVEVRDDGVGTVSARPGGVGLSSMRERAEELGGQFTICGQPGSGTTVRLELPLADRTSARRSASSSRAPSAPGVRAS
jgi:signal transduction histidine kinase